MPNVYRIEDQYFNRGKQNATNFAKIDGIPVSLSSVSGTTTNPSIPAEKIIQSYNLRLVSQDQIDKWDSVFKSIEQNNGVNYRWYQSFKVTQKNIDDGNLFTLSNNKCFYDLDSKSLVIFVNDNYIDPSKYNIINQNKFHFKNNVIHVDDVIHLIHLNKENRINNYDTMRMAIATPWQWSYTNETDQNIKTIELDEEYAFINNDKYSLLVYIDDAFINSIDYEVINTRELVFNDINNVILKPNSTIHIIQLGRVLPNEEYVGYLWGESIPVTAASKVFKLSKDHAFSSKHDKSALVFVDNKISRDYRIINTNTIQFNKELSVGSNIEIIQLGYTFDISKLTEIIDFNKLETIFNYDFSQFIKEETRNQPLGFAGVDADGFIDTNLIKIDELVEIIKNKLIEQGWNPGGGNTQPVYDAHKHYNMDVLNKLQLHNNKLYVDGYPVGEKSIEMSFNLNISGAEITACGFELPNDCDCDRPITLTIENVSMIRDDDWVLIENEAPINDFISWKDKNLEYIIEVNDNIHVTYYKKIDRILPPVIIDNDTISNHEHKNKELLDQLSINDMNQLCINNIPVGEEAVELNYDIVITNEHIMNKEIDIPEDVEGVRSFNVILENIPQIINTDYRIIYNDPPFKDKLNWEDLNIERTILTGDLLRINYYKKL